MDGLIYIANYNILLLILNNYLRTNILVVKAEISY